MATDFRFFTASRMIGLWDRFSKRTTISLFVGVIHPAVSTKRRQSFFGAAVPKPRSCLPRNVSENSSVLRSGSGFPPGFGLFGLGPALGAHYPPQLTPARQLPAPNLQKIVGQTDQLPLGGNLLQAT